MNTPYVEVNVHALICIPRGDEETFAVQFQEKEGQREFYIGVNNTNAFKIKALMEEKERSFLSPYLLLDRILSTLEIAIVRAVITIEASEGKEDGEMDIHFELSNSHRIRATAIDAIITRLLFKVPIVVQPEILQEPKTLRPSEKPDSPKPSHDPEKTKRCVERDRKLRDEIRELDAEIDLAIAEGKPNVGVLLEKVRRKRMRLSDYFTPIDSTLWEIIDQYLHPPKPDKEWNS